MLSKSKEVSENEEISLENHDRFKLAFVSYPIYTKGRDMPNHMAPMDNMVVKGIAPLEC